MGLELAYAATVKREWTQGTQHKAVWEMRSREHGHGEHMQLLTALVRIQQDVVQYAHQHRDVSVVCQHHFSRSFPRALRTRHLHGLNHDRRGEQEQQCHVRQRANRESYSEHVRIARQVMRYECSER
jgi:pyruvate-formate lyase-activating enzyme